jgi:DNA/RNA endonuclease YhcR with UshA esterase domain
MKRSSVGAIPIVLLLFLTLWGCGSSQQSSVPTSSGAQASPTLLVSESPTPTPSPTHKKDAAIPWTKAKSYVGKVVTVKGPVAGTVYATSSNGQPTFLNIGRDYPDPQRFTVVIWGGDRGNFSGAPEDTYLGATLRVTGKVSLYQGIAQIEVATPSQIRIVK